MGEEPIENIAWTETAKCTFSAIVEYLRKEWTEKEVKKFISCTTEMIFKLKRFPEISRPSS